MYVYGNVCTSKVIYIRVLNIYICVGNICICVR